MSEAGRAVFLSYASQDAAAAQRICEALRAAGIEVWFDQSELVGGDAWDRKIRGQIKECALFLPIISANTQARREGYFRLEWRLADQRTHMMGKSGAFIVPICIDDTREAEADVPDSFLAVQWTRLRDGETPPSFCERVRTLREPQPTVAPFSSRPPTGGASTNPTPAKPPTVSPSRAPIIVAAALVAAAALVLALWQPWHSPKTDRASSTRPATAPSKTSDEVARLRARLIPDQWKKEDFEPWSADLDRLIATDDQNADAWALRSIINSLQVVRAYEAGTKPLEAGRADAQRALHLAPASGLAQLALGLHHAAMISRGGDPQAPRPYLNRAFALLPRDHLTRFADLVTAWSGYDFEAIDRAAREWLQHEPTADYPAFLLALKGLALRDAAEAVKWAEQGASERGVTGVRAFITGFDARYYLGADLGAAREMLDRIPSAGRSVHRVVYARWLLAMAEHRWDVGLQELARVPEAIFYDGPFYGPKAHLAGLAHRAAGRTEAAQVQWRDAERAVRELLANDPQNEKLHAVLAVTLACAGKSAESRVELAQVEPLAKDRPRTQFSGIVRLLLAQANAELDQTATAVAWLREILSGPSTPSLTPASLRIDPRFQNIIAKPEVQALLAEFAHLDAKTSGTSATVPAPDPKSIAVLPFENLSTGADNADFTDGMHDEVLTALAKVAALKVIGRTSVLPYRDSVKRDLRKIAADLNVGSVVEGTVRRSGNKVRIVVKLVDTQNAQQLWAKPFEHEVTDVFEIQVSVAEEVAATLRATFTARERAALDRRPTENARAYELYLQAKVLHNDLYSTSPREQWDRAVQLLEEAIAADPNFARAYALLAQTHAG
ncbi:MAG: TIR domain-containing protein, partial [Verrucomicrobia bacterium]|nr:TIR domain-containing protein [Verrucomicrobiota bacterium]